LKFTSLFVLLSVFVLASVAARAWADVVPVNNASFETIDPLNPLNQPCGTGCAFNVSIPSWMVSGSGGQFQPGSLFFTSPVPDGSIVAYSNGASISQTLNTSLTADTTYTLSADIGRRTDAAGNDYTIALYADGTLLKSLTASTNTIKPGTFLEQSLTYTSGAMPPAGKLEIVLSTVGPRQVDYDNVQLDASTVPEPATLSLLAAGCGLTLFVLRRR